MKTKINTKKINTKSVRKWIIIISFVFSFVNCGQAAIAADITAQRMIELTNESRKDSGLLPLKVNDKLTAAAAAKVDDMFKFQYFDHNSPSGLTPWHWIKSAGYDYLYAGENLAIDFVTAEGTHMALMRSITHRDNILKPNYVEIGVAVKKGIFEGNESIIIVEQFGAPLEKIVEENNESKIDIKGDADVNSQEGELEKIEEAKEIKEVKNELVEIQSPVVYFKEENYKKDEIIEDKIIENKIEDKVIVDEMEKDENKDEAKDEIIEIENNKTEEEIMIEKTSGEFILPIMFPVENIEVVDKIYMEDIFWNGYEEEGAVDNLKAKLNDYLRFLNIQK